VRYAQSPAVSTFFPPTAPPTTIEHIANCILIQFLLNVSVDPITSRPQGDAYAEAAALAAATIFIES
jgi:hypothetical protein